MRLACAPVWMLIPELRQAGGNEGRRIMRQAALQGGSGGGFPLLAGVLVVAVIVAGGLALITWAFEPDLARAIAWIAVPLLGLFTWLTVISAAFSLQMWIVCRRLVRKSRCKRCDYSLCEVPKERTISCDGVLAVSVVCPECGSRLTLADAGLCEWDLLPWNQRELSPEVGTNVMAGIPVGRAATSKPIDRSIRRSAGAQGEVQLLAVSENRQSRPLHGYASPSRATDY